MTPFVLLLAVAAPPAGPPYDVRVGLLQLYTLDSATDRHVSYSEARTTFDVVDVFGEVPLEGHGDVRARRGWNAITDDRLDVQRLYAQYGRERDRFYVKAGRVVVPEVGMSLVDGGAIGGRIADRWRWTAFGGLRPHPFTLALDPDFAGGGAGYGFRDGTLSHEGGASVQMYEGGADRVFVSERGYWRVGRALSLYGDAILDVLDGPDLTRGQIGARYRPNRTFDINASVVHVHAIIPNRWWRDWIASERARLGFVLDDEFLPRDSRRSSARVATNVTIVDGVTPYVAGRADLRHGDAAFGYEGRAGIKLTHFTLGYLDVGGTWRRYFDADNVLGNLQMGAQFLDGLLNIDGGGTAMWAKPRAADSGTALFDVNGTVWMDAGAIDPSMSGFQVMGLYQAFIDPEMVSHALFFRVAYRLRG